MAVLLDSSPDTQVGTSRPHHHQLYVVDPANPATATVAADLGTGAVPPTVVYTQSHTAGTSAYQRSYNGRAMALYVNGGKLWAINLRTDASHVPRQLSNMTNACGILFPASSPLLQLSLDGQDAWAFVQTCDGGSAFVRTTMGSGDAPLALGTAKPLSVLGDANGVANGVVMMEPQGLAWYTPDLTRQGAVAGGDGLANARPVNAGRDYSTTTAIYLRFGSALRRLTWTAASASLEPPVYTFAGGASPSLEPSWEGDTEAMYFADGNTLLRLPAGGTPTPMATVPGTPIGLIYATDARVVIQQSDRTPGQVLAVSSVAKAGGPVTPLGASGAVALGITATGVLYSAGGNWHLASADGSSDALVSAGGLVYQRSQLADHFRLDAVAICQPYDPIDKGCSNGTVVQQDLAMGGTTSIGQMTHSTAYAASVALNGYADFTDTTTGVPQPLTFRISKDAAGHLVNTADLYVWTPGVSGSLVRVTNNIP